MSDLYELPNGWEWSSISSIVVDTKSKNPKDIEANAFTYVDIGSVNNETFQIEEPKTINVGEAPSRAKKEIILNDIVYSTTRPNLKNIAIVTKPYDNPIASTGFCVLRVSDVANNRYLFYYLLTKTYFDQIESKIRGAQYPAVSDSDVKSSQIPLPPLTEQQRIVAKLDKLFEKIDKAIALHQKNIDEADAFMGSALNEVFGELEERYEAKSILDGIYIGCKSGYKPTIIDGKVPFIGMSDIDENKGINTKYVMMNYGEVSVGKTKFERNAVLVGKITPCTQNNKTTIVPSEIDGGFATTEVYALHSKNNMNSYYLNHYMRSSKINNYLVSTMIGATGRQRVPSETIKALRISIPPLPIQQKVVTYLDDLSEKIERVKTVQKEQMDSLKALKSSILDKAFRGEL